MEALRNSEVIPIIRSCLISTKGQISLRQLEDDYRTLTGGRIPFQQLGYPSLESFLQSEPSIVTTKQSNGQVFVDARSNESSAHITSMINKQKSAKRKTVRIAPPRYNKRYAIPPPAPNHWRPKRHRNKPSVAANNTLPPKLKAVSHNQFVNSPNSPKKPKVPSKIVVPEKSKMLWKEKETVQVQYNRPETHGINGHHEETEQPCSVRSSTMKRLARAMQDINLEPDSGTSSPTMDYNFGVMMYKTMAEEFTKTGNPINDLQKFASIHKLGVPEVTFTKTQVKKSKQMHCHCKIKIGSHMFSSYPNDFFDATAAENCASEKALEQLIQKYGRRKSLLISSNEDIIDRIPPMLEKHQSAVWKWQIEADYTDKYNEQLPTDWLQVIDSSPYVSIEKCTGEYVLKYCNPHDILQKGKKIDINLNISHVSIPSNTIQLNEDNRLYGIITAAVSVNEIWCQQCATPEFEKFVAMSKDMEYHYTTHKNQLKSEFITFASCYVVSCESRWCRVRALTNPKDERVDVFLVDYGTQMNVPISDLYTLEIQYALEQAQAFLCRLDGLEDLFEVSIDCDYLQKYIGLECTIEMMDDSGETQEVTKPVVIYDSTSDVSINEELLALLTIESANSVLEMGGIAQVYISNVEPNGDVYVQLHSPGYYSLQELLRQVELVISQDSPTHLQTPITRENSKDTIYLLQCLVTKRWLRATIIDWAPSHDASLAHKAQVYFIDCGTTQIIDTKSRVMYRLSLFDEIACQYAPQAVKVRMMIDKVPTDFVARTATLMPKESNILIKILDYDNENVPLVEFFKRSTDGGLFCINKSLAVEEELKSVDSNSNNSRMRLFNLTQFGDGCKTVPSGGSLSKPLLPKKGDYFNVNIPFAVNPWNFFVQPLDTYDELTHLMTDLQEFYKDIQFSPLNISDIVPGQIFASKHEDGRWYRTSVLKVIHAGSISVFYCDFGYYTSLTLDQLVLLETKFLQLPYQALKAKLSGIKPVNNKWTMDDCEIFKSMVTKQQFVSVLVNIEKDELYKSDIVLQLLLVDTSSDEDINIKNLMVEKGIALSTV